MLAAAARPPTAGAPSVAVGATAAGAAAMPSVTALPPFCCGSYGEGSFRNGLLYLRMDWHAAELDSFDGHAWNNPVVSWERLGSLTRLLFLAPVLVRPSARGWLP